MRIDELPYHSSLFYKLNFVSRKQFFVNIGKYPSKMQKMRNDLFLGNKILKKGTFFLLKTISLKTCTLTRTFISFRSSSTKSPFCPTSETPSGRIQCYVWFPLIDMWISKLIQFWCIHYNQNWNTINSALLETLALDYMAATKYVTIGHKTDTGRTNWSLLVALLSAGDIKIIQYMCQGLMRKSLLNWSSVLPNRYFMYLR